jgi:hypothetical protein
VDSPARDDGKFSILITFLESNNIPSLGMGVAKVPGVAENLSRPIDDELGKLPMSQTCA